MLEKVFVNSHNCHMDKSALEINNKICLKIKIERTKRGWSQEQFGEYADLSKNSVGAIERAKSSPTTLTLAKIANAFGMSVSELTDISKVDL